MHITQGVNDLHRKFSVFLKNKLNLFLFCPSCSLLYKVCNKISALGVFLHGQAGNKLGRSDDKHTGRGFLLNGGQSIFTDGRRSELSEFIMLFIMLAIRNINYQ